MKPPFNGTKEDVLDPAAFGRLCVETNIHCRTISSTAPAAFGRLCVETKSIKSIDLKVLPAAFGRLCVETTSRILI